MTFQTWLLFCATETLLSLTPGPAVLLVVGQALGRGGRAGLAAACGILSANAMYFALSATGLGAILLASSQLFAAIKWLGAIYLIIVGLQMIVRPERLVEVARADSPVEQDFVLLRLHQPRTSFWRGFVTQAANPKALVFFTALLPQFIQPSSGVPMQILILGVSSIVLEFGVLGLYVAASTRARRWTKAPGLSAALQRSAGALLIVAGARLALTETDRTTLGTKHATPWQFPTLTSDSRARASGASPAGSRRRACRVAAVAEVELVVVAGELQRGGHLLVRQRPVAVEVVEVVRAVLQEDADSGFFAVLRISAG